MQVVPTIKAERAFKVCFARVIEVLLDVRGYDHIAHYPLPISVEQGHREDAQKRRSTPHRRGAYYPLTFAYSVVGLSQESSRFGSEGANVTPPHNGLKSVIGGAGFRGTLSYSL